VWSQLLERLKRSKEQAVRRAEEAAEVEAE
jgi:hypothetical protein